MMQDLVVGVITLNHRICGFSHVVRSSALLIPCIKTLLLPLIPGLEVAEAYEGMRGEIRGRVDCDCVIESSAIAKLSSELFSGEIEMPKLT